MTAPPSIPSPPLCHTPFHHHHHFTTIIPTMTCQVVTITQNDTTTTTNAWPIPPPPTPPPHLSTTTIILSTTTITLFTTYNASRHDQHERHHHNAWHNDAKKKWPQRVEVTENTLDTRGTARGGLSEHGKGTGRTYKVLYHFNQFGWGGGGQWTVWPKFYIRPPSAWQPPPLTTLKLSCHAHFWEVDLPLATTSTHNSQRVPRWSALLRNKPKNTTQKERTDVLLLILMSWAFMLIELHTYNNLWSKLLVQRVCVWVEFVLHFRFTPYLDARGTTGIVLWRPQQFLLLVLRYEFCAQTILKYI